MTSSQTKKTKLTESGTLNPHADKITDPLFNENDFFDANDLLQAKYEMIRRVEQEGVSVTDAAKNFGFSRRHFYVLQKQLSDEGLHGLLTEKRGPKGAHKLNEEVMTFIGAQIEKDPSLRANAIGVMIEKRFGIKAHRRSVERALKRKKKGAKP